MPELLTVCVVRVAVGLVVGVHLKWRRRSRCVCTFSVATFTVLALLMLIILLRRCHRLCTLGRGAKIGFPPFIKDGFSTIYQERLLSIYQGRLLYMCLDESYVIRDLV